MRIHRILHNERGSAMLLAMGMLILMTLSGVLFMMQTNTETQIAGYDQRSTQALFNAEAGYAEALARISNPNNDAIYIGPDEGDWVANPDWGRYIVMNSGDSSLDPDIVVDEQGNSYTEVATAQGSDAIDYPWVKLEYKKNGAGNVLLFGDHDSDLTTDPVVNLTTGWPIFIVSAEGARGTAQRRVEIEAARYPFEAPGAAIYAEDDNFKFNGNVFTVSGEDHDPSDWSVIGGNPEVPGIATTEDPDNIIGSLSAGQTDQVIGEGANPSITTSNVDLDLEAMRDTYSAQATITVTPGTHSNETWGGLDDYEIVYCPGDLHGSGQLIGGGLLIIDGDFSCSGILEWYGIILVMGDITFTGGGGGKHVLGAVLVQGGIDEQTVGGNADILYSSEALNRLAVFVPYTVISWREL